MNKKPDPPKASTAWGVYMPNGSLRHDTIADSRANAWDLASDFGPRMRSHGWRCRRIRIDPIIPKRKQAKKP